MNKPIKFNKDSYEDPTVSPWDATTPIYSVKKVKNSTPNRDYLKSPSFSPYRPRVIQSKPVARRCSVVIQDISHEIQLNSKEFPKRSLKSPFRNYKRGINRCRSCEKEGISIADLENIERVQQLIPYRPALLVNIKAKPRPVLSFQSRNEAIVGSGIVKESNFTSTFYRKFNKNSI